MLEVFTVVTMRFEVFTAVTMKTMKKKKREKWVVVRDTTGGGKRIYHRFCRFPGIARLSFW
jgi:hypothetical protein